MAFILAVVLSVIVHNMAIGPILMKPAEVANSTTDARLIQSAGVINDHF